MPRPAALIAVLVAVLALPAAASAAYTSTAAVNVVTMNGDPASDTLVIGDSGGVLTHNRSDPGFESPTDFDSGTLGVQTVNADDTVDVVVNAGGGADAVSFTTTETSNATLHGDDGDDTLSGTDKEDDLFGDAGDDRLAGLGNADDHEGGDGDDTLVWNDGDGGESMEGDAGLDTVEFNGAAAAGDAVTVEPDPDDPGEIFIDRTSPVAVHLEVFSERIEINGGGGDDAITVDPALDALAELAIDGQAGAADRVDVAGDATAADTFALGEQATGARLQRISTPDAYGVGIANAEILDVDPGGGDDTLTVGDGVTLGVTFDGGAGDDTLLGGGGSDTFLGGEGADVFRGGPGPDTGTGGPGSDLLDGGPQADTLFARDGTGDTVRCGDDADTARTDATTVDSVTACETLDALPAPATATTTTTATPAPVVITQPPLVVTPVLDRIAQRITFRNRAATLATNQRSFVIALSCPATEPGGCDIDLDVVTRSLVRIGRVQIRVLLASIDTTLRPGETKRIRVRLPSGMARLFGTSRSLAVRLLGDTQDDAGNTTDLAANLTLRLPRKRR